MLFKSNRKRISALLIFSLLLQLVLFPALGHALELDAGNALQTDDALIDSSKPATNINSKTGTSEGLFSMSSTATTKRYAYYKFDLTGFNDVTNKFYFEVSAKKGSSNTNVELSVLGLEDTSWTETTLTWDNAPGKDLATAVPLGKFTVTTPNNVTPVLHTVDVSDYVRSHLNSGAVTFIVADPAGTGVSLNIYTKEATGSNPKPRLAVKQVIDETSDTTPPSWPGGSSLKAGNLGTNFIRLTWPAAVDNTAVTNYRISQNNTVLATVYGATYYDANSLTPNTDYTFTVEAGDAAGNYSTSGLNLSRTTLAEPIQPIPVVGVTASSNDGNIEINTIDNNLFTRWSASGDGQWIMYDLDDIVQVGYVGIAFYKGDMRSTTFDIETSTDAEHWSPAFSGQSSGNTTAMQAFDIPDTAARYVKITGHGNSDASLFTSLTDVHMYAPFANGDTPVAVIPYYVPGPPPGTLPFTQPGMTNPDGSEHALHTSNPVTGRTLNVLDYGADPADNGNDDRPALQAAINAAVSGDEVYLPNGVYNLSSSPDGTMNIALKSGVNLRGESQAGAIIKTSLNKVKNSTALKSVRQHDFVISNLTVTSSWAGAYSTDHTVNNPDGGGPDSAIIIANYGEEPSYNVTIDHVTVEKFSRMGIRVESSHDVVIRNGTFRNATDVGPGGAGYGVSFQGIPKVDRLGFDNDTRWNLVEDSSFEGPYMRHGALIQNVAHNNVIRNNTFSRTKLDAIDMHGELEYFNEIYGNQVTDIFTGGAVGLGNTGGTAPTNHSKSGPRNYIHDNLIRNTREGVNVSMGTPDTIIEHNIFEHTTSIDNAVGIRILNGPGTVIRDNIIRNNTAVNYWGILLAYDNGDQNANNIGKGEPQNVQIYNNSLAGNTNGIKLEAGTGIELKGNQVASLGTNYEKDPGVEATEEWPPADKTGPEIHIQASPVVYLTDTVRLQVDVNDTLSGINQFTVKLDGTPIRVPAALEPLSLQLGSHLIEVSATDNAGNTSASSMSFQVVMDVNHLDELLLIAKNNGWIKHPQAYTALKTLVGLLQKLDGNKLNAALNQLSSEVQTQSGQGKLDGKFATWLRQVLAALHK